MTMERHPKIDELTTTHSGDELLTLPGVYTWVIVSSEGNKPSFFYKRVLSKQELQTKHNNILYDLCKDPHAACSW